MNEEQVMLQLQNRLEIPISSIQIYPAGVCMFYAGREIGSIPYITTPGNVIYDTDRPEVVNWIKWDNIYTTDNEIIDTKIYTLLGRNQGIRIILGTFRRLYVRDSTSNQLLCTIKCSFIQNDWQVEEVN